LCVTECTAVFLKFRKLHTSSYAVGANANHLRKISHAQKFMQVNRRDITLVVKFAITTFFLYTNLKVGR
jgi:hypothetical protein